MFRDHGRVGILRAESRSTLYEDADRLRRGSSQGTCGLVRFLSSHLVERNHVGDKRQAFRRIKAYFHIICLDCSIIYLVTAALGI